MHLLFALLALAAAGIASAQSAGELVAASRAAMRIDPEASRRHAEQALARLAERPDVDLEIRAHVQLCEYFSERDADAARAALERARALLARSQRPALRAAILGCEGEIHEIAGDNGLAMALYQQAVEISSASGELEASADSLYLRGYLRGVRGEFANGLADLQRAISIYEQLGLRQQAQIATSGVAILYNRMGDWRQARTYFESSLRQHGGAGLNRELAITHHNLGRVLENLGEWDEAQRRFEIVFAVSRELGFARGESYALRGLAAVRNARGEPGAAIKLIEQGESLLKSQYDARLRAQFQLQRGIALRALGHGAESATALQEALAIFRKAESPAEAAITHRELARTYAAQGDWRAAHEQQAQLIAASEALTKSQLDQRVTSLRVEFDTEAKEKENALLQREKEASERALALERRANRLQAAVLVLLGLLTTAAAVLAWRHQRTSREMHSLAMTDELTGLPNRRQVLARLAEMLAAGPCALLIVDVDHFKVINDKLGHLGGDDVLRAVAEILRDSARDPIVLGRIGGEEFVLAAPGLDAADAAALAERVCASVRGIDTSAWLPGGRVTVSIGLTLSQSGDTVSDLLRRADAAMYAAKAGGRDRVEVRLAQALRAV